MSRSRYAFVLLLLSIVIAVPDAASARAMDASSEIRVTITAPPDLAAAIAAIGMQITGDDDRYWSATMTGRGSATFRGLPPGTYHVTVDLAGGGNASADVRVEAAEVVAIEATMGPAVAGGARLSVIARHRIGEGTDFHEDQLRDLPSGGNLWALIDAAAPFLISDRIDTGGLGNARSALVGSRGASFTNTALSFGDVDIRYPSQSGVLPIWPDLRAVEAVSLSSGLAPVDIAAPGATIDLVARRGGDRVHAAVEASFTTPRMVANNATPSAPSIARIDSWKDFGFQLGGPVRSRIRTFLSDAFTRSFQEDRARVTQPKDQAGSLFTHTVIRPTDRDEFRIIAALQGTAHAYDGRAQFQSRSATESDRFVQSEIVWDQLGAGGNRRQLAFGVQRGSLTPALGALAGGTVDRVLDGVVPGAPAATTTNRMEGRLEFQLHDILRAGMSHSTRVGAVLGRETSSGQVLAAPSVAETVDGLAARVWLNAMPASRSQRSLLGLNLYVADEIALSQRVTVDAGLRADLSTGSARGAAGFTWRTVSPRAAFHWSPGWMEVFGGYTRYTPPPSLDMLAFGDPGAASAAVYRWNDANGNLRFDPGELGVLVAQAGRGAGVASIAPTLRPPHTDEWTIGFGRRLGQSMTVRGALIVRREHDLLGSVNTGVTLADYQVVSVPDQGEDYSSASDDRLLAIYDRLPASFGRDHFVLTNPAGSDATYDGAEITGTYASGRWYTLFGAMAYRTKAMGGNRGFGALENDQGVIGEVFENPNALAYSDGSVFFDRSYVAKWSTSYHAPHDIRIGVTTRYQDGQPFSRLVVAPSLAQGPEIIQAYRTGRTRFTFTFTLDARIEKGLTIGGHAAAIRLDVFNLTNSHLEVEENAVTGASFRATTAVQPPRTLRLGFNLRF